MIFTQSCSCSSSNWRLCVLLLDLCWSPSPSHFSMLTFHHLCNVLCILIRRLFLPSSLSLPLHHQRCAPAFLACRRADWQQQLTLSDLPDPLWRLAEGRWVTGCLRWGFLPGCCWGRWTLEGVEFQPSTWKFDFVSRRNGRLSAIIPLFVILCLFPSFSPGTDSICGHYLGQQLKILDKHILHKVGVIWLLLCVHLNFPSRPLMCISSGSVSPLFFLIRCCCYLSETKRLFFAFPCTILLPYFLDSNWSSHFSREIPSGQWNKNRNAESLFGWVSLMWTIKLWTWTD